jgi:hypothetical protein
MPAESFTKQLWDFVINIIIFLGYFTNLYHIAFDIDKPDDEVNHDMAQIFDIVLVVDILLTFITSF